jgi:hypothetical protein
MSTEENTTTSSPPISLAELGLETGETVDALADRLGKAVFVDSLNRRVVTRFVAGEEIRAHQERKARARAEAEASAERKTEAARELREAARAQAIAARQDSSPRVEKLGLQMLTVRPDGPEGVGAVVNLTSRANEGGTIYEGGTYRPAPSKLDWMTNQNLEGGSFGPPPRRGKVHTAKKKGA